MSATFFARNGNFLGLLSANTILGLAMPMLIILGGLAGLMLAPTTVFATLPASLQTLAGLLAAVPFSLVMGRFGRKVGFILGGVIAFIGALMGAFALVADNFVLLCVAHLALGAALACYQYFRFAAAEVVSTNWRPVAISLMLTSGLVAAFAGPQVFIAAKDALVGVPLAGAYIAIGAISVFGLVPLLFVRMPNTKVAHGSTIWEKLSSLSVLRRGPVRTAVGVGAVSQGIMVFLMVPTPLAMIGCGFGAADAGDVIRWHVVAMFAPSFFTGFLIKRFGTRPVVITGLVFLILSTLVAIGGLSSTHFYGALVLLGIGWNFGFIGATNMLADAVSADEKSVVQGANDTVIALASTLCAFAAGAIVSGFGWAILSTVALIILVLALVGFLFMKDQPD